MDLPDGITPIELAPGYPGYQIETPLCTATLALHGAHLTHWQPRHTPHPVIYTSPSAIYREGKAIRGGIPLCWPWFNAHPTHPELHPSHGIARKQFWKFESAMRIRDNIEIVLTLEASEESKAHVPFPFELKARFLFSDNLTVRLETTNLSNEPTPVGGAVHSYFAVSSIDEIELEGLQNTPYFDTTVSPHLNTSQSQPELIITDEIDRIYYGTANPITLQDPAWKREIVISKENSLSTVIWNPWTEKAATLDDLPDHAYKDFVCIESCNAKQDTRIIAPDQTHALATQIAVFSS